MRELKREYQGKRDLLVYKINEDYSIASAPTDTNGLSDNYLTMQTSSDSEIIGAYFNVNDNAITAINRFFRDNLTAGITDFSVQDLESIFCESS